MMVKIRVRVLEYSNTSLPHLLPILITIYSLYNIIIIHLYIYIYIHTYTHIMIIRIRVRVKGYFSVSRAHLPPILVTVYRGDYPDEVLKQTL